MLPHQSEHLLYREKYKKLKFKTSASTWNDEFELLDASY